LYLAYLILVVDSTVPTLSLHSLLPINDFPNYDSLKVLTLSNVNLTEELASRSGMINFSKTYIETVIMIIITVIGNSLPFCTASSLEEVNLSNINNGNWLFDSLSSKVLKRFYLNNTSITTEQFHKYDSGLAIR
jgi:hypothetical protein